ncbi:cytidine deaminase [Pontibacillus halophilus JSM 076056 = DSM 19796]|uniref:Cytidine deaminase n=1 Tax=Pontibacillus halophilus JSM 076056 = DSM 19796 TaxID=1385510 RepID=A0A0A5GM28_9BACI|nr:nucleoside deaminase [Pontibacillus halophilus]KGX92999.1 cytidine deaminase [Pontibacillus halophilus JSM 076056 = DSM 19796]
MNRYMERALQLAVENVHKGGSPFGAVLVRNNEIIAEGVNELHVHYDSTAHAEMVVIREAQHKLQTMDLSDCSLYASGEPCPMCIAAMYFAKLQDVYYSQTVEEAAQVGLTLSETIYKDLMKPKSTRQLIPVHMPLKRRELDAMKTYRNQQS